MNHAQYTLLTAEEVAALPEVAPKVRGKPVGWSRESYRKHREAFAAAVDAAKTEIRTTGKLALANGSTLSFRCRKMLDTGPCLRRREHEGHCSSKWGR